MSKKIALFLLLVVLGIAFIYRDSIISIFQKNKRTINQTEVKILFRTPPSSEELASILVEKGIVENKKIVLREIEKQELDQNSFAAGKYIVLSGTLISELVHGFSLNNEGEGYSEVKVRVLFNRCTTLEDVAKNISQYILADSSSLMQAFLSSETFKLTGLNEQTMPSLFIPDEYEMYFDTDAKEFVHSMKKKHDEFWNRERLALLKKQRLNSSVEASTLASIVYSEQSKVAEEWPVIAGLYLNRLKNEIPLQSDPTFKFCWGDQLEGVQRLLAKHRNVDCPYNTYRYSGLPPGPICITPAAVIDAVLNPAPVDYLFMCAKPDYSGEHNFTKSAQQHMVNADNYRRWLRNELNKKT